MSWIHIDEVMEQISDVDTRAGSCFQIAWVRSSGHRKGSIKVIAKARRGVPPGYKETPTIPSASGSGSRKKRGLHHDRGTLPLIDIESNQYVTPLVSHIVEFNLKKVKH